MSINPFDVRKPWSGTISTPDFPQLAISAECSPCSFMYWGYGTQFQFKLENGGSDYICFKEVAPENFTQEDFDKMVAQFTASIQVCDECGNGPAIKSPTTNRNGKCETCFMRKLNAKFEAAQEEERKKEAREDAKMFEKGFTHKAVIWIHPKTGGEDYQLVAYFKGAPPESELVKLAKKRRSAVLNDFTVTELDNPSH